MVHGTAEGDRELGRGMRWALLGCGPMNVAGALCFSPPLSAARRSLGLPESDPFYLWVLSAWILGFGVAYFQQGRTGQANRGILALGAWGKAVFALLLLTRALTGQSPPLAAVAALPDLALAIVFAAWLVRTRSDP